MRPFSPKWPGDSISFARDRKKSVMFLLLSGLCAAFLISCSGQVRKPPLPVNGLLDLRDWDFVTDGSIKLSGYWEFQFNDFFSNPQFDSITEKHYAWVPGVWKRGCLSSDRFDTLKENRSPWWPKLPWETYYWKGQKLGGTGYASYRLTLLLPQGNQHLAFRIQNMGTAYQFYIGDSLAASAGKVGTSGETSLPQYLFNTVEIQEASDTFKISLWVSNFHYRKGGAWKNIFIGNAARIEKEDRNSLSFLIFMAGTWFMVFFVLISFYAYRHKESAILYLSLWALAIFIRLLTADDRLIVTFIPDINFDLLVKLELISGFAMAPLACLALYHLYPREFSRRIVYLILGSLLLLIAIVVPTKPILYSNLVVPYQLVNIAAMAYACWRLAPAMIRRREGAMIIGVGMIAALTVYILLIFIYNNLTNINIGSNSISVGIIFAFAHVLLLARIFSSALNRVENFAGELESTVEERTRELISTQEQLIVVARQTETERIRRRISQDIHDDISSGLNKISWMSELVKMKLFRNKPEEINDELDKIIRASRETVDHLIEIIWSLNPKNDDLESLLAYMRNYITRFFDETPFNVGTDFPDQVQKLELNPELRRNLFLVMKEALNNAAKYSRAENISLEFRYEGLKYFFSISDDGIGFEEGTLKGTGNGMINMRRRMEEIEGQFRIVSEPGKGTRVILEGKIY